MSPISSQTAIRAMPLKLTTHKNKRQDTFLNRYIVKLMQKEKHCKCGVTAPLLMVFPKSKYMHKN